MALQVQSSKSALTALIQGFLVRKTTPRTGISEVWEWPRDENHIARLIRQNAGHFMSAVKSTKGEIIEILAVPTAPTEQAELPINLAIFGNNPCVQWLLPPWIPDGWSSIACQLLSLCRHLKVFRGELTQLLRHFS